MFGIKLKPKTEEDKIEDTNEQIIEETGETNAETVAPVENTVEEKPEEITSVEEPIKPTQEEVSELVVPEVIAPVVDTVERPAPIVQEEDKFNLAKVLGKTETGMKKEFYVFQIKELMAKLGKTVGKETTSNEFVKDYKSLCEFGVGEILVTPAYYHECREAEKKNKNSCVKVCALIDYPNGESSFKARLSDVKDAVKNGVDGVVVVMPTSAVAMSRLSEEKSRMIRFAKTAKHSFGVAIDGNVDGDNLRKTLKAVDGIPAQKLVLVCRGMDFSAVKRVLLDVASFKGTKQLCVITELNKLEEISLLFENGADKVYSPFVIDVGNQLLDKFGVQLN